MGLSVGLNHPPLDKIHSHVDLKRVSCLQDMGIRMYRIREPNLYEASHSPSRDRVEEKIACGFLISQSKLHSSEMCSSISVGFRGR